MILRWFRYLLTRSLFACMGLSVTKWRKRVEHLWALSDDDRRENLEKILADDRPLNADGEPVTRLDDIFSSPSLSKKQLRSSTGDYKQSKAAKFGRHTAGTTGEPTHIFLDRRELSRMLGVRDYCLRHYGVKLGQREARLWGRPESGFKAVLKNFVMNRRVFHPVGDQSITQVQKLLAWQPDYLYGYASLLLEAAKALETRKLEFTPPKCIVCTAETILPAQKDYIARVFNSPVAEEYGSTEFDIIAFECSGGHRHFVNPWLIVEESEKEGCLISDISRSSQSLIRYRLGDHVSVDSTDCHRLGGTKVLDQLEGRSLNRFAYLSRDEKFHSSEFAKAVDRYQSASGDVFGFTVFQYQYGEFLLDTTAKPKAGSQDLADYITERIGAITGRGVKIRPIDHESNKSGSKRGYFVQKMDLEL